MKDASVVSTKTKKARRVEPTRRCPRSSARAILHEDTSRTLCSADELRTQQTKLELLNLGLERLVLERTGACQESVEQLREEIARRSQAEKELRSAKDALERRAAQLQALALELTWAEERERRRVAEVLHGDLQQLLVGARLRATMLGRPAGPAERARNLASLEAILAEAIQASRSLSHDLAPPILGTSNLLALLEWLAERMKHLHDLDVTVLAPKPLAVDSEMVRALLFRAVRELLLNVVKHADARQVTVEAAVRGDHLCVTVADEGRGFDAAVLQTAGGGLGLPSVRERLGLVGGSLEVTSSPDKGTCVTIQLPTKGVDLPGVGAPN
jgi:signal transduction histidine kinase